MPGLDLSTTSMRSIPACAAGVLLFTGPEALLPINATTFIVSALLLTRLCGVGRPAEPSGETLLSDTRTGIRAAMRDHMTRTVMCTSGAVVMVAGTMNVAELVLARRELGADSSGLALLVCASGSWCSVPASWARPWRRFWLSRWRPSRSAAWATACSW